MKAFACSTAALACSTSAAAFSCFRDDFRVVDLGEELVFLHSGAVVNVEYFQISRDLGVEIGFLERLDRADLGRGSHDSAF